MIRASLGELCWRKQGTAVCGSPNHRPRLGLSVLWVDGGWGGIKTTSVCSSANLHRMFASEENDVWVLHMFFSGKNMTTDTHDTQTQASVFHVAETNLERLAAQASSLAEKLASLLVNAIVQFMLTS